MSTERPSEDLERIQEELRESERFLSNVFRSIQDGICVLDTEFNILRVNETMERWYAHAMPLVGRKCYEVYHGRHETCEICPVREALENSAPQHETVPKVGPGGRVDGWLDLFGFPLYDAPGGRITGIIEYVRDITEQKRAEDALRESEAKYRALVQDAGDAIMLFDTSGRLVEANARAAAITGRPLEALTGLPFAECHAESEREKVQSFFRHTAESRKPSFYDSTLVQQRGAMVPVDVSLSYISYRGFQVIQAVVRDMTELRKVERLKEQIIRNLAHKLKTPIATAQMAYDLLADSRGAPGEELFNHAMTLMRGSILRLKKDVERVLEYFRDRLSRRSPPRAQTPLRPVVESVIEEARELSREGAIEYRYEEGPGVSMVPLDEMDLYTLLQNLVDNAAKFTKEGTVTIGAEVSGNAIVLRVTDTGAGIPADALPRVFEGFYQINPAYAGLGLGLAICRELVEDYGGNIEAASAGVGEGTVITVTLPMTPDLPQGGGHGC